MNMHTPVLVGLAAVLFSACVPSSRPERADAEDLIVEGDVAYLDSLLRQGVVDGIYRFSDPSGRPRFDFLLASQQSGFNAFDERYFKKGVGNLIVADGVLASEALDALYAEPELYGFECATAISVLHYTAIRDAFRAVTGDDQLFDHEFKDMKIGRLELGLSIELLRGGRTHFDSPLLVGDHGYFRNPDVAEIHRLGGWNGENVIYLGGDSYFGHPFGITDAETIMDHLDSVRRTDIDNPRPSALDPGGYRLDAEYLWKLVEDWMERPLDPGLFYRAVEPQAEIPNGEAAGYSSTIVPDVGGRVTLVTIVAHLSHDRASELEATLSHGDTSVSLFVVGDADGTAKIQMTTDAQQLGDFIGVDPRGPWQLTIADTRTGSHTGSLELWSLSIVSE